MTSASEKPRRPSLLGEEPTKPRAIGGPTEGEGHVSEKKKPIELDDADLEKVAGGGGGGWKKQSK
jgi:hypothetical protein